MISHRDIVDAFHFRHACKAFDPARRIGDSDFEVVLEAARLSPSSFGYEPWRAVVIQNPGLRERLLPMTWGAQKQLPTASHYVAMLARRDGLLPDGAYVQHMLQDVLKFPPERIALRSKTYQKFIEHDFRLLDSDRALFDWASRQAYIALGNMMTVAALMGIDSCPIEGFEQERAEAVLVEAGIMNRVNWGLAVMVAFGYRVQPQPEKLRRPMAEVVQWVE
ncbi:MAG: NAD(P)H-dependent oxidoreductase [Betaproteobacteria bacterium]|nr:NAD(P)H-dependent oxidoreductase [Betaproteobacteria bacterium]